MQRSSEFPLFVQTSALLFGFLALVALLSWVAQPKAALSTTTTPVIELAATK